MIRVGDDAQQLVADGVAEGVVDALEAVEVDEHRRDVGAAVVTGVQEHLLGAVHDQRAVREAGERVVQRLVAELAGLLVDHLQRAGAAAGEHLHQDEREQAEREPDDEHERGLHLGIADAGGLGAGDRHGPAAVGLDRDPLRHAVAARHRPDARDRGGVHGLRQRPERGAGAGRDPVLGHGGVLALEADGDAALAGDGGGEDRLGVEEADDPAGRVLAASVDGAGDAAAVVDGRDHLEHLVAVAGGHDERAELAGVARLAEQLGELAEVQARAR